MAEFILKALVKAKGLELSERTFQDILEGCEEMLKSA